MGNNIFIPALTKGSVAEWVSSRDCVWGAPDGFHVQRSIMQWYDDIEDVSTLLRSTINIQDATVEAVIGDLISKTPSNEYLKAASEYFVGKLKDLSGSDAVKKVR
jgi:hypothetical protein